MNTMSRTERRRLRTNRVALEVLLGRISRSSALEIRAHLPSELGRFSLAELPPGSRFSPYEELVEAVARQEGDGLVEAEEHLRGAVRLLGSCLPPSVLMLACGELREAFRPVLQPRAAHPCGTPVSPLGEESALPLASAPPSGGDPYVALRRRHALDDWN